jgi:two-component system LytT family response regulator
MAVSTDDANDVAEAGRYEREILVSDGHERTVIAVERVAYFVHALKVRLVTVQGRGYALDFGLDELEEWLDPRHFFRLNTEVLTHRQSVQKSHVLAKGRVEVELWPPFAAHLVVPAERAAAFRQWWQPG